MANSIPAEGSASDHDRGPKPSPGFLYRAARSHTDIARARGWSAFYVGLRVGDSELGLVADAEGAAGAAGRILLSIAVEDVDSLLARVKALGGSVRGQPNNMPWDSESRTSPTPMATPSTSPSQSEVIRPRPEAEDGAGRSQEARTTKGA